MSDLSEGEMEAILRRDLEEYADWWCGRQWIEGELRMLGVVDPGGKEEEMSDVLCVICTEYGDAYIQILACSSAYADEIQKAAMRILDMHREDSNELNRVKRLPRRDRIRWAKRVKP